MPQPKIFISYRRADEPDFVDRIRDRFIERYGRDNVFIDLDISGSAQFKEVIVETVNSSDVFVAIIGCRWLELLEEKSKRSKEDYLLLEVKTALNNERMVITPVLIKNAPIPDEDILRRYQIERLLRFEAKPVRSRENFDYFIDIVIEGVRQELERRGFRHDQSTELDKILNLTLQELNYQILSLIEDGDKVTRIKLLLREFLPYIQSLLSDSEVSVVEDSKAALDRLIVIGTTLAFDDQQELFVELLDALRSIYKYIEKIQSPSPDAAKILFALGIGWHTLGAVLIREEKYSMLSRLVRHSMQSESNYGQHRIWFHHLQRHIDQANLLDATRWIKPSLDQTKNSEYFGNLLQIDGEAKALDLLCQFEFIQSLFYLHQNALYYVKPGYCCLSFDLTLPILKVLMSDSQIRELLFGENCDHSMIKKNIEVLLDKCFRLKNGHHNLWKGNYVELSDWEVGRFIDYHWVDKE